jgi:hypothetical protein
VDLPPQVKLRTLPIALAGNLASALPILRVLLAEIMAHGKPEIGSPLRPRGSVEGET